MLRAAIDPPEVGKAVESRGGVLTITLQAIPGG